MSTDHENDLVNNTYKPQFKHSLFSIIRIALYFLFFYLYLYIYSCVVTYFALSIERTCPDLHFTTDYILYNWVCDE